ncbi:MAG: hypothetical protein DRP15_03355, partial [Candidatus Aenigmatarchaeota archaeon]
YVAEDLERKPMDGKHPLTPGHDYNRECERMKQKRKFEMCKRCIYFDRCEGVYKKYAEVFGDKGFRPVI